MPVVASRVARRFDLAEEVTLKTKGTVTSDTAETAIQIGWVPTTYWEPGTQMLFTRPVIADINVFAVTGAVYFELWADTVLAMNSGNKVLVGHIPAAVGELQAGLDPLQIRDSLPIASDIFLQIKAIVPGGASVNYSCNLANVPDPGM